jgi:hypothetical protein
MSKASCRPPLRLSAYRLNFKISAANKEYDIVTKDYGGELLEGRREERLNMLISQVHEGKRTINVPVELVLTKRDRAGDLSWDVAREEERALRYVEQLDWLCLLYGHLKILCPHLKVFPVCSFVGDKPSLDNLRSFNITAPMLWAADQSEAAMLLQAQQMSANDEYDVTDKLALHWLLLHIEKIMEPGLREQIEQTMQVLSRKLLETVHARVAADAGELPWVIGQYRQFLQTKGVHSTEQEEASRSLRYYQSKLQKQYRRKRILVCVLVATICPSSAQNWSRRARRSNNMKNENKNYEICKKFYSDVPMSFPTKSSRNLTTWQ